MALFNKSILVAVIFVMLYMVQNSTGSPHPQIEILGGYDIIGVCVRNCAQCKTMLGSFFNGQLCAESCINFNGKIIPDCEDLASITPYLNKMD